jgi:hypothetical protein
VGTPDSRRSSCRPLSSHTAAEHHGPHLASKARHEVGRQFVSDDRRRSTDATKHLAATSVTQSGSSVASGRSPAGGSSADDRPARGRGLFGLVLRWIEPPGAYHPAFLRILGSGSWSRDSVSAASAATSVCTHRPTTRPPWLGRACSGRAEAAAWPERAHRSSTVDGHCPCTDRRPKRAAHQAARERPHHRPCAPTRGRTLRRPDDRAPWCSTSSHRR